MTKVCFLICRLWYIDQALAMLGSYFQPTANLVYKCRWPRIRVASSATVMFGMSPPAAVAADSRSQSVSTNLIAEDMQCGSESRVKDQSPETWKKQITSEAGLRADLDS